MKLKLWIIFIIIGIAASYFNASAWAGDRASRFNALAKEMTAICPMVKKDGSIIEAFQYLEEDDLFVTFITIPGKKKNIDPDELKMIAAVIKIKSNKRFENKTCKKWKIATTPRYRANAYYDDNKEELFTHGFDLAEICSR